MNRQAEDCAAQDETVKKLLDLFCPGLRLTVGALG
jgi:hypothetical protein